MPGFPVHRHLPEFAQTSIELMMPCNHLIFCCPFLLLPSIFPSISELTPHQVAKVVAGRQMVAGTESGGRAMALKWELQFQHQSFQ